MYVYMYTYIYIYSSNASHLYLEQVPSLLLLFLSCQCVASGNIYSVSTGSRHCQSMANELGAGEISACLLVVKFLPGLVSKLPKHHHFWPVHLVKKWENDDMPLKMFLEFHGNIWKLRSQAPGHSTFPVPAPHLPFIAHVHRLRGLHGAG